MKLEDQVCSLELAKRLKELGVKQDSEFSWELHRFSNGPANVLIPKRYEVGLGKAAEICSAFTVAELGEMLPEFFISYSYYKPKVNPVQPMHEGDQRYWLCYNDGNAEIYGADYDDSLAKDQPTEADARARMLVHLLESKLITPQKETPR